jgi:hypothetical protein
LRALVLPSVAACSFACSSSRLRLPFAKPAGAALPFAQDDDWSGVAGLAGYRGDGLVGGTGVDPQAIVADGSGTPLDVLANQANPASLFIGGVAEFELSDPAVALQPSATADAPHLVLTLNTTGWRAIALAYVLRDLDASDDDAVQPVALQYRVGRAGDFVNVPAGFVPDATAGPGLADLVTRMHTMLPSDADGEPLVQVRVLTANAAGSDEWVGVDSIAVSGLEDRPATVTVTAPRRLWLPRALRRGVPARVGADERITVRTALRIPSRLARRLGLPAVVGRTEAALDEAGSGRIVTRFSRLARRELASLRALRVSLRVVALDAAGDETVVSRRIFLFR